MTLKVPRPSFSKEERQVVEKPTWTYMSSMNVLMLRQSSITWQGPAKLKGKLKTLSLLLSKKSKGIPT